MCWDWRNQGFKLNGKFKFPKLEDFGKPTTINESFYPPEEQDRHVIKVYDKTNVDEIKDQLPPYVYDLCKRPEEWNTETWKIRLVEYKKMEPGGKFVEWTEQNKGRATLDADGKVQNYTGGYLPFHPDFIKEDDPQAGLKIAYNLYWGGRNSDDHNYSHSDTIVDRNWNERITHGAWLEIGITGRRYIPPMPEIQGNSKGIHRIQIFGWANPYDIRGIIALLHRFEDPLKWDDQWLYIPAIRRERRMSAAQRQDSTGVGDDATFDDLLCWYGKPLQYEWKFLGRKEYIVQRSCRPLSFYKPKQVTGYDDYYQKVNAYVVEARPKETVFGPHIYSKLWMLIDPDLWWITNCMYYDNRGNFWKSSSDFTMQAKADKSYRICNPLELDWQRKHHSDHRNFGQQANLGVPPEWFTMENARAFYGVQR